jgi:AhpD family alkylhydroperoxidase
MASAPALLDGFVALREIYQRESSLTPLEIQVLSIVNAYENGCGYCVALHSALAAKEGLAPESLAALRAGRPALEPKLAALGELSRELVRNRGRVGERAFAAFRAAGYRDEQALEVVLGVAVSVLPNFAHHLTDAPLDAVFASQAWEPRSGNPGSAGSSAPERERRSA